MRHTVVFYRSNTERKIPYWTYAGSAVRWCGSASGPDPPSGPVFCSGGASAGLLCPAALLAVKTDEGKINKILHLSQYNRGFNYLGNHVSNLQLLQFQQGYRDSFPIPYFCI